MIAELNLPHGSVPLPAFFPDGTRGTVKSAAPSDLDACKVTGIVANAYHLMSTPGQSAVKSLGGLNKFINWNRPILTDSGGFQVFSLIGENAKFGEIQDDQIIFRPENSRDKIILTPEKCIRAQFDYGSDVMMCLDYCIHSGAPAELIKKAVEITIKWAKRCRAEYDNIIKTRSKKADGRPLIFGIIQGAGDKTMRKECADALIGIGFDGFAFGGWPADEQNNLACDILAYTAQLMPDGLVKYAMGV
ncbi:MAG: tRNA-guanine transglycosylase, partial [Oscillospiraceae bacterium]|nr:tRNA-guanine transglycosylase [Oscillospiraceae bacterium]